MMDFSVGGASTSGSQQLGSPLDVQYIVEQLMLGKQEPIRDLQTYETFYEAKKSAFQELNTKLTSLESSLYTLNTSGFESKTAQLSNDDFLSATAGSTAETGDYYIKVRQLATAQSDSSTTAGITDADAYSLTDGETFSITQGDNTVDIDITGSTRSLNGLKNAINSSDLDVTATVINDGTDYHLQITAGETGEENAFTVTDTDVGTGMATKITAQDSLINVNTEDAGDAISRSTNTVDDVIEGVTLNLLAADATSTTTLSVTGDTANLKENIEDFVEKFNSLKSFLDEQFAYDTEAKKAGVLSGESAARKVQTDVLTAVSSRVDGIESDSEYSGLFSIGVTLNSSGSLEIDEEALDEAIADDMDAVKRIFKNVGSSTSSDIQYIGKGDSTVAGTYNINITQVAEKATVEGTGDVGTLADDETLTITINGTDYTAGLTSGMDINDVVSAINTVMEENNAAAFATSSGDRLVISSESSGSSQSIGVVSDGTGVGFGVEQTDTGQDVAGTIGGLSAEGEGNVLTGTEGDANGMMVYVSASTVGDKGDIYLTFGVGESLRQSADDLSYPVTGLIAQNIEGLDDRLENISDQITRINQRLAKEEELLITQFTRANEALVELQYLQSSLNNNLKA